MWSSFFLCIKLLFFPIISLPGLPHSISFLFLLLLKHSALHQIHSSISLLHLVLVQLHYVHPYHYMSANYFNIIYPSYIAVSIVFIVFNSFKQFIFKRRIKTFCESGMPSSSLRFNTFIFNILFKLSTCYCCFIISTYDSRFLTHLSYVCVFLLNDTACLFCSLGQPQRILIKHQ